ncbi:unnamed protein product [Musa acuminata subsp. malaccensis]|uniref:(wild Malaysian banana) hypothetical protein n=1 Tax=Musa acuminata subsp. malaccensis TaxID=214687 RepID=A0A804JLB5_MUSAM|nr:unnamed protein product [Musa acuminata subsp. malaccensis]
MAEPQSFPDGTRNCYTIKPGAPSTCCGRGSCTETTMASTTSRSASTSTSESTFGRHNITDPGSFVTLEAITVASADFLWVCLVNTGYGTPFISALEARPLKDNLYPAANASRSLVPFKRINLRAGDAYIRYPDDPHDCRDPRNSTKIDFSWDPYPGDVNEYYLILHFSELSILTGTDTSRQFNVYVKGYRWLRSSRDPALPEIRLRV